MPMTDDEDDRGYHQPPICYDCGALEECTWPIRVAMFLVMVLTYLVFAPWIVIRACRKRA